MAADYIKNRPFYDNMVIVPFASTPTANPWQIAPAAADEFFNNLSSHTVRYSGTDYHLDRFNDVSWRGMEFRGAGGMLDDSPHSEPFTSNDIPFVIFRSNIKQIDPKFIPYKCNEVVSRATSGLVYGFCGKDISSTTLTEARSIYLAQRPYLTFNGEPFITAELTDSSITIVYMGKGEDGQYGVQKTTFGNIAWKSETT